MRKIAFFLEGLTEVIFTEKLLFEIYGKKIKIIQGHRRTGLPGITQLRIKAKPEEVIVLLYNCQGDSSVRSEIDDNRERLTQEGYHIIIGLKDLYPDSKTKAAEALRGLYYQTPQKPIPTKYILAIMETESCFLWEMSHCEKLHPYLTIQKIRSSGIKLYGNYEDYRHPAETLNEIYKLAGIRYVKSRESLNKTIHNLDYADIYMNCDRGWIKEYIETIHNTIDEIGDSRSG